MRNPMPPSPRRPTSYQEVKLFSVSGRIGRVRYLVYGVGMYILIAIAAILLSLAIGAVAMILWIPLMVMWLMLTIQRCHDFNTRGWLSILVLVPLVNLIFLFIPGTTVRITTARRLRPIARA